MRVLIFLAAVFLVSCSKQDIEISQGGGLSSHTLKEKTVVLNIWADWCPPCIVEMPYFNKLNEQGNTVVIIEHNLDVIVNSDWIIDLGPEGGSGGGEIIGEGTPEEISKIKKSHTGRFLKEMLN